MHTASQPLKICVIGAGVIGCASAHTLARAGHSVTLLEAAPAPATLASSTNGAQLSYCTVEPLATPALRRALPAMLLDHESPFNFRLAGGWPQLAWSWQFLRACRSPQLARATRALLALSFLSRDELLAQQARDPLDFQLETRGKLVLLSDLDSLDAAAHQVALQRQLGCEQELLRPTECLEREPALAALQGRVLGGIWTPAEQVGDAHRFSTALVERLLAAGGQLRMQTRATGFTRQGERITAVQTDSGDVLCDAVVLANGVEAAALGRPLGLHLPLQPVKGYSITLPIRDAARAPAVSVTDAARKVTYARLGDDLRVAGMIDLVGQDLRRDPHRIRGLINAAKDSFPGSCEFTADPQAWTGLRPSTPTGLPLIGPTRWSNLWLNLGHGGLGFTLAMGSARLIERWIAGDVQAELAAPFLLRR